MKKPFLIILAAILFVILLATFLHQPQTTWSVSQPLGRNMRFATQSNDDQINYFNGSAFISHSISKGTSKALSPILTLPNITDVRWGSSAVVFKAGNYSSVDQLYPLLQQSGLPQDQAYWWLCDFKTGKISLIGSNLGTANKAFGPATDVIWSSNGQLLTFLQNSYQTTGASKIIIEQTVGSSPVKIGQVSDAKTLVNASQSTVYLITSANPAVLERLDISSQKLTTIGNAYGLVATTNASLDSVVYIGSNQAAAEGSGFITGDLIQAPSLKGSDHTIIAHNVTGNIKWDGSSWIELGPVKTGLAGYLQYSQGETSKLSIDSGKQKLELQSFSLASYRNGNALILSPDSTAYLTGKDIPVITTPNNDSSSLQKPIYTNDFYSTYDDSKKQFTIYILHNPYQAGIAKSISYFQQAGVDPFQLNIKWYPYDGVTIN